MAFDYERIKTGVAERLLERFGKPVTLIQPGTPSGSEYDPIPGTPVEISGVAVEVAIKDENIDGALIKENDRMFLLGTAGMVDPQLSYTFNINSTIFQVVRIKPLQPGPTTMLWRVQCRK